MLIMKVAFQRLLLWNWLFLACGATINEECTSPQYLELGKNGTIQCLFRKDFFGVVWYNSTDIVQDPILVMKDSVKSGAGYLSGEYDVHSNGSLIIHRVSLQHEGNVSVLKFDSNVGDPDLYNVRVETFVKPEFPYPLVSNCPYTNEVCVKSTDPDTELKCSILKTRPAVNSVWVRRTSAGDRVISARANISSDGVLFSSYVSTKNVFQFSQNVEVLVCKTDGPKEVIYHDEKQVLLLNRNIDISSVKPQLIYFQRHTEMELRCEDRKYMPFVIWIRLRDRLQEYLVYSISIGGQFEKTYHGDFQIGKNGSLYVSETKISQEGKYYCIFGNGFTDWITAYDMRVFVNPLSPHPVVDGCRERQNCMLKKKTRDNITCSLDGIRPDVRLEWKVLHKDKHSSISFHNDRLVVKANGDTFNVELTSEIHIVSGFSDTITLECTTSGPNAFLFSFSTKFDVLVLNEHLVYPTQGQNIQIQTSTVIIIALVVVIVVFIIIFGISRIKAILEKPKVSAHHRSEQGEEVIPMNQDSFRDAGKKDESDDDILTEDISVVNEKYTLPENLLKNVHSANGELRVVVLGQVGVGKSSTANSILGEKVFFEDYSTMPTTLTATCATRKLNGISISVIDTRGLDYPSRRTEDILEDITRIAMQFSKGVHVFLYVLNAASPRFNKKDLESITEFENLLGGNVKNYRALVYSHADSIDQEMDLDTFWNEQRKGVGAMTFFLNEFERNVVAVNNSATRLAERKRNQTAIVTMIDQLRQRNKKSGFLNDIFINAEKEKTKFRQKTTSMKWNPDIVASVDKIWASQPDLKPSSEEFVENVMLQIEERKLLLNHGSKRTVNKAKSTVLDICAEFEKMLEAIKAIVIHHCSNSVCFN